MAKEFNFIHPRVISSDIDLFMGPLTEDDGPFIDIEDHWILAHVMHAAGFFPSVGQAKKNGWDKPIDRGFSHFVVGKRRVNIWILSEFNV